MSSHTDEGEVIRVSKKGQATIPKDLRDRFGIDTPGKVLIHEDNGKIVVDPLPSVEEMQGVHAGDYETGAVLDHLRAMRAADEDRERARDERLER
ncbi:MAG: AbrB/MazE/SpoVT family DNA-binding domain-containing protein [Halococcoides sp.]